MKTYSKLNMLLCIMLAAVMMAGCSWSRMAKGGVIGGAAGGAIGGVIGHKAGNTAVGVIVGAAVGGAAGAAIGRYMDKQAEELKRDLENAKVERVGEGIKITFDSGLLFDFDSYELKPAEKRNIMSLSETLNKYEDTEILVQGHTDNVGKVDYNQNLSEKRAMAVAYDLNRNKVDATRILTEGYGMEMPVADNKSAAGRQQNRRVEVAIYANKKLKRAAERGQL